MDLDRFALTELPWAECFVPDRADWQGYFGAGTTVAQGLNALGAGGCTRFADSVENLSALEYEKRALSGLIPTRDNLHDLFNGLMWLRWPLSKRRLNELHVSECELAEASLGALSRSERPGGNGRSRRRDALTLFDESGAVMVVSDPRFVQWLAGHHWNELLVDARSAWAQGRTGQIRGKTAGQVRLHLFGHGLLESMCTSLHKGLCAKVLCVHVDDLALGLDHWLAAKLERLASPRELCPLPVLGVPGWCAENSDPAFYQDASVFRAKTTL